MVGATMRKRLLTLALAGALALGVTIPAMGHSISHSHSGCGSHGIVADSTNYGHSRWCNGGWGGRDIYFRSSSHGSWGYVHTHIEVSP